MLAQSSARLKSFFFFSFFFFFQSTACSFGLFNGFGILPVFQGFCEAMVAEGAGLKSWGAGGQVCVLEGGGGVGSVSPGQFSTSGIYEALRYAVMQKDILKLTKRPSVQAFFLSFLFFSFSSRTSSSVLGTIFRRDADYFSFYEAFGARFKTWHLRSLLCATQ